MMFAFQNQLAGDFFYIIADSVRMDYLGVKVNFGRRPDSVSDYILILPGAELKEKIRLSDYYQFLSGKHTYNIGTKYIPLAYSAKKGAEYSSPDASLWIRSKRITFTIDGDKVNNNIIQYFTVR
ncbi:hypothetical protein PVC88_004071 [Cronobacter sakazakii]|nr:hypothetical protein [Cronobacter sakazakii]